MLQQQSGYSDPGFVKRTTAVVAALDSAHTLTSQQAHAASDGDNAVTTPPGCAANIQSRRPQKEVAGWLLVTSTEPRYRLLADSVSQDEDPCIVRH